MLLVVPVVALPVQGNTGNILIFGDSISAAYGIEQEQGWAHLLQAKLNTEGYSFKVINASISGDTTGGGLIRLPKALSRHRPDIVVIELGGNDGLRGYPISKIRDNIEKMINLTQASGARVLVIGMVLPPNYGRRYTEAFLDLFQTAAKATKVPLIPYLLEGTDTPPELIQRDGIHPTAEAQVLLLDDVWPSLHPLLQQVADGDSGA